MHFVSSQKGEIVTAVAVTAFVLLSVVTLAISSVTQNNNKPIIQQSEAQTRNGKQCSDWCATKEQCADAQGKFVTQMCTYDGCGVKDTAPCVVGTAAQTGETCSDWCAKKPDKNGDECLDNGGKRVPIACSFDFCSGNTSPCLVDNAPQQEGPKKEQPQQRPPSGGNGDESVDGVPLSDEQSPNQCKAGATKGWYCERNRPGINGEPAPNCIRVYWNKSCGDYYKTDNARGCCRVEGKTPTVAPQPNQQPSGSPGQPTTAVEPTQRSAEPTQSQSQTQKCAARNLMIGSQCASTCTQPDKRCQVVSDGCWRCVSRNVTSPTRTPAPTRSEDQDNPPGDQEPPPDEEPTPRQERSERQEPSQPQESPQAEEPSEPQDPSQAEEPFPDEEPESSPTRASVPTLTPRCATGYPYADQDICVAECEGRCESSTSNTGKRCFRCPVNLTITTAPSRTITPSSTPPASGTRVPSATTAPSRTPAPTNITLPTASPTREPQGPNQPSPTLVPTSATGPQGQTCTFVAHCDERQNYTIAYAVRQTPNCATCRKEYYKGMSDCNSQQNKLDICPTCNPYGNDIKKWCSDQTRRLLVQYSITFPDNFTQYDNSEEMEMFFTTSNIWGTRTALCKKSVVPADILFGKITRSCTLDVKIQETMADTSFEAYFMYTYQGKRRSLKTMPVEPNWEISPAQLQFIQVLTTNQ